VGSSSDHQVCPGRECLLAPLVGTGCGLGAIVSSRIMLGASLAVTESWVGFSQTWRWQSLELVGAGMMVCCYANRCINE